MVYYFTSTVTDPPATIYVGKDKFENEELIKFGWDCDFHADNLSSAHIYLRLTPDQTWDSLPSALLEDCAQLTKANSIEGNKKDNVTIIYTPWSNLHKTAAMATGQVGFHDPRKTRRILTPTRSNPIINRLQKTRTIISADELPAAKESYLNGLRAEKRREAERKRKEEERALRERREEKEGKERSWRELAEGRGEEAGGRSNEEGWDEDDFM
ncbi:hypothetical protein JMJ35_003356 [Cladonia borealis]|uniref:NFACT RNA-binding domain-containing protein n=1 Tax=Cladonia borealis TaxID=184061 RepID=A0AA39V6Q4_9LECA|nr:hypothetical protein JMJ35_003356 [Cladonia borealis]